MIFLMVDLKDSLENVPVVRLHTKGKRNADVNKKSRSMFFEIKANRKAIIALMIEQTGKVVVFLPIFLMIPLFLEIKNSSTRYNGNESRHNTSQKVGFIGAEAKMTVRMMIGIK